MNSYNFWTRTDYEGIREYNIKADSCKKAYEILIASGYLAEEITITGYKGVWKIMLKEIVALILGGSLLIALLIDVIVSFFFD